MASHQDDSLSPNEKEMTPQSQFVSRRFWLQSTGLAGGLGLAAAAGIWWRGRRGEDDEVVKAGRSPKLLDIASKWKLHPAVTDRGFRYGRAETLQAEAARFTNFYEFSRFKSCWRHVEPFEPVPWTIKISGLCRNPITLDLDQLFHRYRSQFRERQYRHRCVERWAMAVPWTGMALNALLKDADPLSSASHVKFTSFLRPQAAVNQIDDSFPWPYVEGLRLDEAMHDLTFLATGVYDEPLLKQHGAPVRIVVPWKYGYKSPKSIQSIEFVDKQPETFWSTIKPAAYPFESNVGPSVPRPWPQHEERMLGTDEIIDTVYLNGYASQVAQLYAK